MRARRWAPLLLAATATGCLPDRTNPLDPAEAPLPLLRVVDRTAIGGCETSDPEGDWPTAPAAFRGTCLALDARATSDPQGTALENLSFRYERVPEDESLPPEPLGEGEDPRGLSVLLLETDYLRTLPVGSETTFRVTVQDGSGAYGSTTTGLTMLNHAPVADPPPLRILPLDAAGSVESISFVASAGDADGDDITQWRWTDAAGSVLATTSSWTLSVATDVSSRRIVWVEAFDGVAWSERAPSPVRVGREAVWATANSGSDASLSAIARVGERRMLHTLLEGGSTPHDVRLTKDLAFGSGTIPRMAITTDAAVLLVAWPDMAVLDTASPPMAYSPTGTRLDPEGNLWLATQAFTNGFGDVVRQMAAYSTAGDVLTPVIPEAVEVPANFAAGEDVFIETDDEGHAWVGGRFDDTIRAFGPSTSGMALLGSTASPSGSAMKSLTRRPGSPGIWALQGQATIGSEQAQPALLHLTVDPGGSGVVRVEIPIAAADVDGLAWEDADRFWAWIAGHGLCLVDLAALEAAGGASLDAAIEIAYPTSIAFSSHVNDPIAGVGWWSSTAHALVARTSLSGAIDILPGKAAVRDVDPDGGFWFIEPTVGLYGTLSVGEAPSSGSIATELLTSAITAAPDGQGGLWLATVHPRSLQRIASDGSVIDSITELDLGTSDIPFPVVLAMGFDGAGTLVVHGVVDQDEPFPFFRVDVANRAPFSSASAPAEIIGAEFVLPFARLYVPPAAAGEHFFWQNSFSFSTFEISLTDPQGASAPVMTTSNAQSWKAEISRVDGRLCIADAVGASVEISVIDPVGVVTLTTSMTFGSAPRVVGVGFSADPDGANELCWIGVQETELTNLLPLFHLYAYDDAGSFVRGYEELRVLDAEATSLAVLGEDSVWVLWTAGSQNSMEAVEFNPLGVPDRLVLGPTRYDTFIGR